MKTFREFITEVYDPDVVGKSQIRKQGEGGRVGRMRKKTEPVKEKNESSWLVVRWFQLKRIRS